eukprot:CAMPEP_0197416642 /NCGR_PEP_ID=MMETSP1170-20131217/2912_1 /TAXON_ID=54406 /ORGANISM="Sarcinochrysis sp, Strain CCMP770" /LENGTH=89 /DNA_ID=CAMNT_0042943555 /DNA_START=136 /DNA_END=402 /DNA_ORIENTATION=+
MWCGDRSGGGEHDDAEDEENDGGGDGGLVVGEVTADGGPSTKGAADPLADGHKGEGTEKGRDGRGDGVHADGAGADARGDVRAREGEAD